MVQSNPACAQRQTFRVLDRNLATARDTARETIVGSLEIVWVRAREVCAHTVHSWLFTIVRE
jgi:hypothetical protein